MTNRKAIEILNESLEGYEDSVQYELEQGDDREWLHELEENAEALRMAIRALERQCWVPVAERLPEEGQPVLVSRIRGREKRIEQGEKAEGDWWRIYGTRTKKVEAWMPLPEPYEEDIQ